MCVLCVCLYQKSIFISFSVILCFNLRFIAYLFFHLSNIKLPNFVQALKILITVVFSDYQLFFRHSFRWPCRELFWSHKPTFQDLACGQCRLTYTAKRVIVLLQANISVANIYIGLNQLTDMQAALLRHIIRDFQKLLETVKDCIALALLGVHLNSADSHPVVFLRSEVSIRILVQQYQSKISFHNHFVNAKDGLLCLRISLGICAQPQVQTTMAVTRVGGGHGT